MFSQPPGLNPPPFSALGVTHTAWSESTADPPFSFFCVLLDTDGDIIKSPFTIKMNRDASLYALGCEILRISSLDLATYQFTLWRPKTSIPAIQTELPERLKSLKPIENGGETEGLNIAMTVDQFCAAYQPGQLDIHILVLLHHIIIPPGIKRLRTQFEEGSATAYLSGPMIEQSPSTVATYDRVRWMQQSSTQHVANNRPIPDLKDTPIALLYHGFGRFLDNAHGQDADGVNFHALEASVRALANAMRKYCPDEETRRETALPLVNAVFRCHPSSRDLAGLEAGPVYRDRTSDGHASGPTGAIEVIIQVKNELGTTRCDPEVQLAAHYSQSLVHDDSTVLRSKFLSPALGIALLGDHIGFYALAFIRGRTRLVALTPLLPMGTDIGNSWARTALLRAFQAACVLRSDIHKDAEKFRNGTRRYLVSRDLPYVNQVPAWPATPEKNVIEFDIIESAYKDPFTQPDRFLYSARVRGFDKPAIAKFARSYFLPLHDFCAERVHAPKVLGYGVVPDGWHVIVMEQIPHDPSMLEVYAGVYRDIWSRDLRQLVGEFHEKGWVHGDLRVANFIVSEDRPRQIMLIDFDWGGDLSVGKVRYPTSMLIGELVDPDDPLNLDITKERDDRVLASALAEW